MMVKRDNCGDDYGDCDDYDDCNNGVAMTVTMTTIIDNDG